MPPEDLFSAELIRKAQEGDAEAFGEIYEHIVGPMYRFALFRSGEARQAEQATEEIFLRIWKSFRKFDPDGKLSFSVWLYQVAREAVVRSLDELKKLTPERRKVLQEREAVEAQPVAEYQTLLNAFQEVPVAQAEALILKYFCHLSNSEIALVLEKTEGAIRILQSRGLKKLRELLDQETVVIPSVVPEA